MNVYWKDFNEMNKDVNRKTIEAAYDLLVGKILDLTLKPGEVVTEFSLSGKYGIGRTPIREALKRLELEGLIQTRNRTKIIQTLRQKDVEEIFDIKIMLESKMARMAAIQGDEKQRQKLAKIIQSMRDFRQTILTERLVNNDYLEEWLDLDRSFHSVIFEMADNERVVRIIHNLNLQWHRFKVGLIAIEDRIEKAVDEHYVIGMAIINNKPAEAESLMREHLSSLRIVIITVMRAFVTV